MILHDPYDFYHKQWDHTNTSELYSHLTDKIHPFFSWMNYLVSISEPDFQVLLGQKYF